MKSRLLTCFAWIALIGAVVLVALAGTAPAQCTRSCSNSTSGGSFVTLYSFAGQPDAARPLAALALDPAGNLYGTTFQGGTSGVGTAFKLDAAGTETVLYSFTGGTDGAYPTAGLVLDSAGNLYGSTSGGGSSASTCASGCGVVFKVDTTGKETVLYSFSGAADGSQPFAGLFRDTSGDLYGTTSFGGAAGNGVVFKLDEAGTETVLHNFPGGSADGTNPQAGLIQDQAGDLYGTTSGGGTFNCASGGPQSRKVGCGIAFKLDATGTESVLYSFAGKNDGPDGAFPIASLVRDAGGNLYGTTFAGGAGAGPCYIIPMNPPIPPSFIYCGIVFRLDATGAETVLHRFAGATDGASPRGGLVLDGSGNLYGTTFFGGTGNCVESGGRPGSPPVFIGCGTVFKLDATGNETVLYSFTGGTGGAFPAAGLLLDAAGNLYGTTSEGGTSNNGTVFKFNPAITPATFTLSVALAGSGTGMVTSNPAGISCGATCSASFVSGTTVTLAAGAAPGSSFSGWSGACSGTNTCSVTLNAAESVTATFSALMPDFSLTPASASLTVQPGGQGMDTITIAPQNGSFANAIQLSCSVIGPSPMPTCGLSPTSVTPGANPATSTLTITAPASPALLVPSIDRNLNKSTYAVLLPLPGIILAALALVSSESRKRKCGPLLLCGLVFTAILAQAGCGGGSSSTMPPSQPASYTVTVTGATSGGIQHRTQITVSVP